MNGVAEAEANTIKLIMEMKTGMVAIATATIIIQVVMER